MNQTIKKLFMKAAMNNPQIASHQFFEEDLEGNMIPRENMEEPEYLPSEENYDPFGVLKLPLA